MDEPIADITEEETAYHEAAHAVALWALRRSFDYVTVIPRGDTLGHVGEDHSSTMYYGMFPGDYDALMMDEGVICLAGYYADSCFQGDSSISKDDVLAQLTGDDRNVIHAAAQHGLALTDSTDPEHPAIDIGPVLDEMIDRTTTTIFEYWGAIDAVAQQLLVEKTLDSVAVARIASGAPGLLHYEWLANRGA